MLNNSPSERRIRTNRADHCRDRIVDRVILGMILTLVMGGVGPQHTSGDTDSQLAFLVRGILRDFFLQLGQLELHESQNAPNVQPRLFQRVIPVCSRQPLAALSNGLVLPHIRRRCVSDHPALDGLWRPCSGTSHLFRRLGTGRVSAQDVSFRLEVVFKHILSKQFFDLVRLFISNKRDHAERLAGVLRLLTTGKDKGAKFFSLGKIDLIALGGTLDSMRNHMWSEDYIATIPRRENRYDSYQPAHNTGKILNPPRDALR